MANMTDVPETPEGSPEIEEPSKEKKDTPASEHEGSGGEGEEDEEDEEEEYEIERIINARKGHFENARYRAFGRYNASPFPRFHVDHLNLTCVTHIAFINGALQGEFGYLVKWKGYGEEHNSWVRETDAGNATDLIAAYWKLKKEAANKKQSTSNRGRQSLKNKDKSKSPGAETATSKRSRGKSNAKSVSDDEQEDSEIEQQKKKKKRLNTSAAAASSSKASAVNGTNGTKKRTSLAALNKPDDDVHMVDYSAVGAENVGSENGDENRFTTMKALKFNAIKNWEDLVKQINTVERASPKDELMVYFITTDGKLVREPSSVCRRRFPNKLLDFYESHLRWKASDEDVAEGP